jgi:cytoskeletal protein RodZ
LKSKRELKGLSIGDLSRATKIKEHSLEALEGGRIDELPAPVFVRGFVIAYARAVEADERELLGRLAALAPPSDVESPRPQKPIIHRAPDDDDAPANLGRRRVGVVMVVLLILVVATLTLSLLLRHGSTPGSGIS